jgi:exopolyphosphatase/guanosine-5'-triphosphate,3'-diphosphate pyrophosphatase
MVAMSGDMRFAASLIARQPGKEPFERIDIRTLANLVERLVVMPIDELVRRYHIAYHEAETIGPALLSYEHLARVFHVKEILVAQTSLRDGLLREMAVGGAWTQEFAEQAVHAAGLLARKYSTDQEHSSQVAELAVRLFRELQPEHGLEKRFELHLKIAALLHEVGMFISDQSHHKHSMYVIQHSELFGLTKKDTTLIALVARYHRRALPRPYHIEYHSLDREDRLIVSRLSAILRVADALDRKHTQQLGEVTFTRERGAFVITARGVADLALERLALKEKGDLFEQLFGMKVNVRNGLEIEEVSAGG